MLCFCFSSGSGLLSGCTSESGFQSDIPALSENPHRRFVLPHIAGGISSPLGNIKSRASSHKQVWQVGRRISKFLLILSMKDASVGSPRKLAEGPENSKVQIV